MGLKGKIKENHIPLHSFELVVPGVVPLTLKTSDDIEERLNVIEMPDRTKRTSGEKMPVSFTGTIFMHHDVEVASLEAWYKQCQAPVDPAHRKAGSMVFYRLDRTPRTFSLVNLWISGRTVPGGDMENEGEPAMFTYFFEADEVNPV